MPGEDWVECMEVPEHQTQATVPNLKEGEKYQFRVRAINSLGPGEASKPTDVITAEDQPCKPTLDLSGVKDVTVHAGQEIRISVPFKGVPKPTAKWFNGDNEIDHPRSTCAVSTEILHYHL
jgi:hypothetical protein